MILTYDGLCFLQVLFIVQASRGSSMQTLSCEVDTEVVVIEVYVLTFERLQSTKAKVKVQCNMSLS